MIYSPVNDFDVILQEQGQPITIRKIYRTINTDGKTTNITYLDTQTTAVIDEYKNISVDVQAIERYAIGDVKFSIKPDVVITNFDKIIWNNSYYEIKFIHNPTKVANQYLYRVIECAREKLT